MFKSNFNLGNNNSYLINMLKQGGQQIRNEIKEIAKTVLDETQKSIKIKQIMSDFSKGYATLEKTLADFAELGITPEVTEDSDKVIITYKNYKVISNKTEQDLSKSDEPPADVKQDKISAKEPDESNSIENNGAGCRIHAPLWEDEEDETLEIQSGNSFNNANITTNTDVISNPEQDNLLDDPLFIHGYLETYRDKLYDFNYSSDLQNKIMSELESELISYYTSNGEEGLTAYLNQIFDEVVDKNVRMEFLNFGKRLSTDEFNITVSKEEALRYIDEYKSLWIFDLSKDGYSKEYLNFMFDFIENYMNIDDEVNLKEVLQSFRSNIYELTWPHDNRDFITGYYNAQNINTLNGILDRFVGYILTNGHNLPEGVNEEEFINNLIYKLNECNGYFMGARVTWGILFNDNVYTSDLKKFDSDNDGIWFNDLYEMVSNYVKNYDYMESESIDTNALFGDKESLIADDIINNYQTLFINENPSVMKFMEYLENFYEKFNIEYDYFHYDHKDLLESIFTFLDERADVQSTTPPTLQKETIEKLNRQDIFAILEELKNDEKLAYEYYFGVDGKIDIFGQGGQGDCWLLSSLISINAKNESLLDDIIDIDYDNNIVTVNFKGLDTSRSVSINDMINAIDSRQYSTGDNDILAIELAVEQLINEGLINGDYAKGGRPEAIIQALTGKEYVDKEFKLEDFAALADDFNSGNAIVTIGVFGASNFVKNAILQTIDGEEVKLPYQHAYGVVDMTDTTITIVNPWNSDKQYTFYIKDIINHNEWSSSEYIEVIVNK